MSSLTSVDAQRARLACAFALVSERCRNAYMHDLKGGLQSLHSAVELMSRSAGGPAANPAMTTKMAALAKRALATHESELLAFSLQTAPSAESRQPLDLGALMTQIVRFLGHDAMARSLTTQNNVANEISVMVEVYECRMLLLGLCITSMDVMPLNSIFSTAVYIDGDLACIELPTAASAVPLRLPADWLAQGTTPVSAHELLLGAAAHWTAVRGGNVSIQANAMGRSVLLRLPIAAGLPVS